ncbi:MAG: ribosome assembly cofactor RimP [Bacteroidetes bacterium B1(2017)]|nr:MAG: ribosome assembly cofactor RimP [Bacteroidetes bacterium B1(2017)]
MQIVEQIKEWSAEVLEPSVFVVDVEFKPGGGKLLVLIDSDGPLTIEQCRTLNKHLSTKLDETDYGDTPYTLEVSSPGVDRPLLLARQYQKHIGRELKVTLKAKTELLGKLIEATETSIQLHLKDKKKAYLAKEPSFKTISLDEIEETLVQVSFN